LSTTQVWKEEAIEIFAEYPCKVAGCIFIFHSKQFLLNHYKTDHTLEELARALVEDY